MATYTKRFLSESVNGKAILVAATSTPGTLLHTAVSGTADMDELWIYANNTSANAVKLTIEWGEATAPNGNIEVTVLQESGLVCITPGLIIQNGLTVRAFAATTNVITIHGYNHRIAA